MLLNISTKRNGLALSFLLHKHPDKVQTFKLNFGEVHVFYPEYSEKKCSFALLLDINPINIIRERKGEQLSMSDYVNDRPYVCSSFMSTAIAKVLGSALNGKCPDHPEFLKEEFSFKVKLSAVSVKGKAKAVNSLFQPLGYTVGMKGALIDEKFPEWGTSNYFELTLSNTISLQEMLSHLYVLLPVLDNSKHYYMSNDEVNKLLDKGGDWLENHPEKEYIIRRYFKRKTGLTQKVIQSLKEENIEQEKTEEKEKVVSLHDIRLNLVTGELKKRNIQSLIDLGCGEGKLLQRVIEQTSINKVTGLDVSFKALKIAQRRLKLDNLTKDCQLIQGALTYQDDRMKGFDCATLIEVIEHIDEERLKTMARVVFEFAQPNTVIMTTPNGEYNIMYENLHGENFRHTDHRFEWSRYQFETWVKEVADQYNYEVTTQGVGEEDQEVGCPSQMAIFTKKNTKS